MIDLPPLETSAAWGERPSRDDWQPGDPVYADQAPTDRSHCGPCMVAWTADVATCPECGEPSTEQLRVLAGLPPLTSR